MNKNKDRGPSCGYAPTHHYHLHHKQAEGNDDNDEGGSSRNNYKDRGPSGEYDPTTLHHLHHQGATKQCSARLLVLVSKFKRVKTRYWSQT